MWEVGHRRDALEVSGRDRHQHPGMGASGIEIGAPDASVGELAANEGRLDHARQSHVGDVRRPPGQQTVVLEPLDPLAEQAGPRTGTDGGG